MFCSPRVDEVDHVAVLLSLRQVPGKQMSPSDRLVGWHGNWCEISQNCFDPCKGLKTTVCLKSLWHSLLVDLQCEIFMECDQCRCFKEAITFWRGGEGDLLLVLLNDNTNQMMTNDGC